MDKELTCKQIIEYLEDPSFPSIVLLNGAWGSGKTFLVKNYLNEYLVRKHPKNAEPIYISLYGVTSLDDFRDKLISQVYTNTSRASNIVSTAANTLGSLTKAIGDKGAALGVVNALGSPIRHKLLSKLNNISIVVDDLERASSDKLISEVLGECLNLAENRNNVWTVIVANDEHLDGSKPLLEKTFLNKVSLHTSADEIIQFLRDKYKNVLDEDGLSHMRKLIGELSLYNYRVIQRILHRYVQIKKLVDLDPQVNAELSSFLLIDQITRICYAHYEHGYTTNEISGKNPAQEKFIEEVLSQTAENPSSEPKMAKQEDEREAKLKKLLHTKTGVIRAELVEFCINLKPIKGIISDVLDLPLASDPLEMIASFNIYNFSDEQFNDAVNAVEMFLFDDNNKPFYKWFRVLNAYLIYIERAYIQADINTVIEKARGVSSQNNFFEPDRRTFYSRFDKNLSNDKVIELCEEVKPTFLALSKNVEDERLHSDLINSWNGVSNEILLSYDTKPFLHNIDTNFLVNGIIENWSFGEIIIFGQFMESSYKVNNIYDFLGDELSNINKILSELELKKKSLSFGMKKGAITDLVQDLNLAVKKLTNSKNRCENSENS